MYVNWVFDEFGKVKVCFKGVVCLDVVIVQLCSKGVEFVEIDIDKGKVIIFEFFFLMVVELIGEVYLDSDVNYDVSSELFISDGLKVVEQLFQKVMVIQ